MNAADRILELRDPDQLRRRERSDRDDQLRFQQRDLAIEMRAAIRDLGLVRHAIAAAFRVLPRKTSNHRSNMDALTKLLLGDAEVVGEPGEEAAAGGVGERTAILDLVRTRRLTDQHHTRTRNGARHRQAEYIRARPARVEKIDVLLKVHSRLPVTGYRLPVITGNR